MKKLIFLLCLFAKMADAQLMTAFCTEVDSTNYGGGYFCNQDSLKLNFYDHSTGAIVLWKWTFHGAADSTLQYTTFTPMVSAKWDTAGYYRVTLVTVDTAGMENTVDVGVTLSIAQMYLNHDTVYLAPGDSVNLIAYGNGGPMVGYSGVTHPLFQWSYNGAFLQRGEDDSTFMASDTGTYIVIYRNGFGCEAFDTVVVLPLQIATGISNDYAQQRIVAYPNPASDVLHIKGVEGKEFSVYDISGKMLLTSKSETIDVSKFAAGSYFIDCPEYNYKGKFMITH